jgi:hypothetical protein
MLSRYQDKMVRVVTEGGEVFTGTADYNVPGYGLVELDRSEESITIEDTMIFKTDIRKIEEIGKDAGSSVSDGQYQDLIERLLEAPYEIMDILPEQVPQSAGGQYFSVERYWLRPERRKLLRRKQAEILLGLNCYYDMLVVFDGSENWERNPDPEAFALQMEALSGNAFLRALFPSQEIMIELESCDTYMTVFDPDPVFLSRLRLLAGAAGFFVWKPEGQQ